MKPSTPDDLPISRDSLRHVRGDVAPAGRVSAPRRSSTPPELADVIEQLHAARAHALEQFEAGAALIVTGLHEYGRLWQHAVQVSRAIGDNDSSGDRPAIGGPLQPMTSKWHPRHLKAALARVLTSRGITLIDSATKRGARKRGRR